MIHLVVRLTYVPGREAEAREYERTVLRFFVEHGGEVLAAFKPNAREGQSPADEVQLLRIASAAQLDAYMRDERRTALAPVREASIATTEVASYESAIDYPA